MVVEVKHYAQHKWLETDEYREVLQIANDLLSHLNSSSVQAKISQANLPGRSSREVQDAFLEEALSLGFRDESRGLFSNYANKALRPDYYKPLGDTGILLEVERGKTTTNNMDFLDFWKCHICENAHYLFLLVPQTVLHANYLKKEYITVQNHLSSFFEPKNYTNVRGLALFGY